MFILQQLNTHYLWQQKKTAPAADATEADEK